MARVNNSPVRIDNTQEAIQMRHEHSNIGVLNSITDEQIIKWDTGSYSANDINQMIYDMLDSKGVLTTREVMEDEYTIGDGVIYFNTPLLPMEKISIIASVETSVTDIPMFFGAELHMTNNVRVSFGQSGFGVTDIQSVNITTIFEGDTMTQLMPVSVTTTIGEDRIEIRNGMAVGSSVFDYFEHIYTGANIVRNITVNSMSIITSR